MRRTPIVRQVIASFIILMGLLGVAIYPLTAAAISLNESAVVQGNVVTLGDIFTGLPSGGDKILGPAPLPGKQMTLDARTLLRIATAMDLPWRPETGADRVVLRRAATVIDSDMIKAALKTSLRSKGANGDFRVSFNDNQPQMILPENAQPNVEVTNINYQPEKNWFEADLVAPSKDNPVTSAHISGRLERMAKVPVLRQSLNNGDVIGERDIDFIEMPQTDLTTNVILKAEDLLGMTPRQVTLAGQPINSNQIEAPIIINRGDIITMQFNAGGLQLTAQGKALENGAKGDKIRVANVSSNKTIVALVTNTKEVTLTDAF